MAKIEQKRNDFKYRYSVRVREMQRNCNALAKFHQYEESKAVSRTMEHHQSKEHAQIVNRREFIFEQEVARLKEKQDQEQRFLSGKIRNMKRRAEFEMEQDATRLQQQCKNLMQDMSHAHKLEFVSSRSDGVSVARSSHVNFGATYQGSRLHAKLRGDKFLAKPALAKEIQL